MSFLQLQPLKGFLTPPVSQQNFVKEAVNRSS
jgi:hypothetical protein